MLSLLAMTVNDGSLHFDFTGTDPQLESSLNIPTGGDERHTLICVGMIYALYSLDPTLFLNAGIVRILTSTLPGTMINPEFPAAVGMRTLSAQRLQGVILGAFARALPDTMQAAGAQGGAIMNVNTTDNKTGRRLMAAINPMTGGAGGRSAQDGADGSGATQGFLKNTPIEINEAEVPIRFHRYGLKRDSGGPGLKRGGLATGNTHRTPRVTARNRDRTIFQGWGFEGRPSPTICRLVQNPGGIREPCQHRHPENRTGDVIYVSSGGAGGWGDPLLREPPGTPRRPTQLRRSAERAQSDYGARQDGAVAVATAALRASLRNRRPQPTRPSSITVRPVPIT
ncbi:MAG: hydantoinase B/oxoprolinase family protein [Hyphomicrobiaceae bacterium]